MKIKWYGHSCFEITSNSRMKIITDPFDERVGYNVPSVHADIITVSHSHYDHDNTSMVKSKHVLINTIGENFIEDIKVIGIKSYHDDVLGEKRGENIIYKYYFDNLVIGHLGDLGDIPPDNEIKNIEDIDILLIPVGGIFTIDAKKAFELTNIIHPKILIPMHYKTDRLRFDLEPVDNFAKYFKKISYLNNNELTLDNEMLKEHSKVYIFDYKN